MPTAIDLTGKRFGRLLVMGRDGRTSYGVVAFRCKCDCGNVIKTSSQNLRVGICKSCGCLRRENTRAMRTTHGFSKSDIRTPEYNCWINIRERCSNPKATSYPRYGALGISVCPRWNESFENFLADMGTRPPGMSIDRINVSGNYEPGNCRWATRKEQSNNKRNNIRITFNGKTLGAIQWAIETGIPVKAIYNRVSAGWNPEETLTLKPLPIGHKIHKKNFNQTTI